MTIVIYLLRWKSDGFGQRECL